MLSSKRSPWIVVACTLLSASANAQTAVAVESSGAPDQKIRVHLDGPSDLLLQHEQSGAWFDICDVPCDRLLPREGLYRTSGGGVRDSNAFLLRRDGDHESLTVDGASNTAFSFGEVLVGGGAVVFTFGGILVLLGATWTKCSGTLSVGSPAGCSLQNPQLIPLGIGVGVAGALAVGSGILLMVAHGHSTVTTSQLNVRRQFWGARRLFVETAGDRSAQSAITPSLGFSVPPAQFAPLLMQAF